MKKSKFWLVWLIYFTLLAVAVAILWGKTWGIMKTYEAAQPCYVADELLEKLSQGAYPVEITGSGSKFESAGDFSDEFNRKISGKDLSYQVESHGSNHMVYGIYADEEKVATATIDGSNQQPLMVILSTFDWEVSKVEGILPEGHCNVHIELPIEYTVAVNGVKLTNEEQVGELIPMEGMEYVAEYVEVPYFRTYEVEGLHKAPTVEVWDGKGNPVTLPPAETMTTEEWTVCLSLGFEEQEMPADLKEYVIQAAKDYSNFYSGDLAGSSQSTACIQKYFPVNSYYIGLAEKYRREDMWMYSNHSAPSFSNVEQSEYIVYNDYCFSTRVVFDKTIHLTRTGDTRIEHTDQTYYYVKIDNKWVIADMKTNV